MPRLYHPVSGTAVDVPDTNGQLLAYYRGEGYVDRTDLEHATPPEVADTDFDGGPVTNAAHVDETDVEHAAPVDQADSGAAGEPDLETESLDLS